MPVKVKATKYPLDCDDLRKGDIITVQQLESITGLRRDDKRYPFKVLEIKTHIERAMLERGDPVTVRVHHDQLELLTDSEATAYNDRSFRAGMRRAFRSHGRMLTVDRSMLDDEEDAEHERKMLMQGRILQAVRSARRLRSRDPLLE